LVEFYSLTLRLKIPPDLRRSFDLAIHNAERLLLEHNWIQINHLRDL